jgi:hypothetical protein
MGHITQAKELLAREETCKHPPERLFSWMAEDCTGKYLCIGCCECGKTWEKLFPKERRKRT